MKHAVKSSMLIVLAAALLLVSGWQGKGAGRPCG